MTLRDRLQQNLQDNDLYYYLRRDAVDKILDALEESVKDWLHDGAEQLRKE